MPDTTATPLFYSNWRELDAQLIWVYLGRPVRSGGRIDAKQSTAWLITNGTLNIESSPPRKAHAGQWVFPGHQSIPRLFSEDAEILSIKFILRWPDGRGLLDHAEPEIRSSQEFPELERTARSLNHYAKRQKLTAGNLMQLRSLNLRQYIRINQLFQTWLLAYIDAMEHIGVEPYFSHREDTRIIKAKQQLDTLPLSEQAPLADIASHLGLSQGHADTLFNEAFGQTMRGYLQERKLRAARHWLAKTKKPIKEIAFDLGFHDGTAFTHWFKKKSGAPPSRYRQTESN